MFGSDDDLVAIDLSGFLDHGSYTGKMKSLAFSRGWAYKDLLCWLLFPPTSFLPFLFLDYLALIFASFENYF